MNWMDWMDLARVYEAGAGKSAELGNSALGEGHAGHGGPG